MASATLTERLNSWIGKSDPTTTEHLNAIAWALAMDDDLHDDFNRFVRSIRKEHIDEMNRDIEAGI